LVLAFEKIFNMGELTGAEFFLATR